MRKIILASASPKRKELLEKTGIIFEVFPSSYEEDMTLPMPPGELVKFLSKEKALDVAKNFDNAIIISADTIALIDDKIIGKPHTKDAARKTLKMLSGKVHSVFTGFTILDTNNNKIVSITVETKVTFKELSNKMIDDYIIKGNPLKYAGSYTVDDVIDTFIEKIEGDSSNIIGLPVREVMDTLKEFNINIAEN